MEIPFQSLINCKGAFPYIFTRWDTGIPDMVYLLGIKIAFGIFGNRKWKTRLAITRYTNVVVCI